MISPYDSIDEVNAEITLYKGALKDIASGKSVRLGSGGNERIWTSEDLDKLQNHLVFLSKERAKFQKKNHAAIIHGRPSR